MPTTRAEARKLTIAHVLQWFDLGGGESVALQLASRQRQAGHRVLAIALSASRGPLASEFIARQVAIGHEARLLHGYDPTLYPRLWRRFVAERVDVVHAHDPQSLVYAAVPARLARAVAVYTKHGVDVDTSRRMWLVRSASLFLHAFVAVSDKTAETACANREAIPTSKVEVIANGIDIDRFGPDPDERQAARAELGIPDDAWVVGTVGRLEAVKNHGRLIRAMAPLLADGAQLVIVGEGSARQALAAQAAALPVVSTAGAVHLVGMRRDIPRLLRALDAFAISSDSEGLPLALLEAMAAGLPVVSTAVGGIPAVLADNQSGLLVPTDDAALGAALRRLRADPLLAGRLGQRARATARQHHSLEHTIERYMTLYRQHLRS